MKAYKGRIRTQINMLKALDSGTTLVPRTVRVQSVYYGGTDPNHKLHLYDKDRDEFMHPISGQGLGAKTIILDSPVTISDPIYVLDESGTPNDVVVFGEIV